MISVQWQLYFNRTLFFASIDKNNRIQNEYYNKSTVKGFANKNGPNEQTIALQLVHKFLFDN